MPSIEHSGSGSESVVSLDEYEAMAQARDRLADTADRLIRERDDARRQLKGAVDRVAVLEDAVRKLLLAGPSWPVPETVDDILHASRGGR